MMVVKKLSIQWRIQCRRWSSVVVIVAVAVLVIRLLLLLENSSLICLRNSPVSRNLLRVDSSLSVIVIIVVVFVVEVCLSKWYCAGVVVWSISLSESVSSLSFKCLLAAAAAALGE